MPREMGIMPKVIYSDINRNDDLESKHVATYCNSLEELLQTADFVSLHVPLLDSTKHLINEARLRLMKPTSYLINTSRGPIVDEKALLEDLKGKIISGAALDVFESEPDITRGLVDLENVILTPHIASASESARKEMAEIVANNIIDFFEGRLPRNIVNK
jgi:glyoxylate reductase